MTHDYQASFTFRTASESDRPVLERLWTMFRHEMSAYSGALPGSDGRFRQERLDAALIDQNWAAFVLHLGDAAAGFAIVRDVDAEPHVMSSFFLVHGARRTGYGQAAVRSITHEHPGVWAVAFQDRNTVAARFWRRMAIEADDQWSKEYRAVPGRPDLPPDSWITFRVE